MRVFTMRCPVCDATFHLERSEAPVAKPAPPHAWVRDGKTSVVKCLGEGQALLQPQ